jgi:hypothetical protein
MINLKGYSGLLLVMFIAFPSYAQGDLDEADRQITLDSGPAVEITGTCFPPGKFEKEVLEVDIYYLINTPDQYKEKFFRKIWASGRAMVPEILRQIVGWQECLEEAGKKSGGNNTFGTNAQQLDVAYTNLLGMVTQVYPGSDAERGFSDYDFATGVRNLEGDGSVTVRVDLAAHLTMRISASKRVGNGPPAKYLKMHRTDDLIAMVSGSDGGKAIYKSEMIRRGGIPVGEMWAAILFHTCRAEKHHYIRDSGGNPWGDCPSIDPKEGHKAVGNILGHVSVHAGEEAGGGNVQVMKAKAYLLGQVTGHLETGFLKARKKQADSEKEKITFGYDIVRYSLEAIETLVPVAGKAVGRIESVLEDQYNYEINQVHENQPKLPKVQELIEETVALGFNSALKGGSFDEMAVISADFSDRYNAGRKQAMGK